MRKISTNLMKTYKIEVESRIYFYDEDESINIHGILRYIDHLKKGYEMSNMPNYEHCVVLKKTDKYFDIKCDKKFEARNDEMAISRIEEELEMIQYNTINLYELKNRYDKSGKWVYEWEL